MNWSPKQDAALLAVESWLRNGGKQVFRLFGYAGTGKTTLAMHFAKMVDGVVLFGAYTGKAASVLRSKGCANATTLHSMIYLPKEKSRLRLFELETALGKLLTPGAVTYPERVAELERAIAEERRSLSRPSFALNEASDVKSASLIIVDEVSMVDARMGMDLLSFNVPVLVLGDPAQLPPVAGGGFFTEAEPDIMLTEIHRQARENPIIDLATRVREGDIPAFGEYGSSRVISSADPRRRDLAVAAEQILCGRNTTRKASNALMRQLRGIESPFPVDSDKLVCLRNNHDLGLLNGALWRAVGDSLANGDRVVMTVTPFEGDGSQRLDVEAHNHYFLGEEKDMPWWERKLAEEFDFGYALTVHKAQGSQWNTVYLIDESGCFRADAKRHLYTAITRAAESVTIVR